MKFYKTYKLILSTPLIVDIPSSYYHRQDFHFHNQYYQKILPNSGTSPLGLTLQCNVWSGEEKIERKPYIQPAAVVRSAFGYEEFYRNSEIQSWKKELPFPSLFDCSALVQGKQAPNNKDLAKFGI